MRNIRPIRPIRSLRKQQGFSLIELAIVIALVAVLAFFVFQKLQKVQGSRVASDEANNAALMIGDAKTKFTSQGDFAGVTSAALINAGVVPKSMVNAAGNAILTGWGTTVVAAPTNVNGTANDGIKLTYPVPKENCNEFVTGVAGLVQKITVGTTVVKNAPAGASKLDMIATGTACDAGGTGNVNVILETGR